MIASRAHRNAIDKNVPAPWHLFHKPGDILLTAGNTPESLGIRSLQAGLRARECLIRGCYPRFSHVVMCVMAGLFIESSPRSLRREDRNAPAVTFLRAEDFPTSRSDFLVLRHHDHCADRDFGVKILLRSIFHGGKPYHFYLLGDDKDRVFCSELVATIYEEAGKRLIADRDCRYPLPFDVEGIQDVSGWMDVTKSYLQAEELCSRGLIANEAPDLRDIHLRQYQSSSEAAEALTKLAEAANTFVEEYDRQMSRAVALPVDEPPRTYVGNIKELLGILKKHYPTYLNIRRYRFDGSEPELMRFNGVKFAKLVADLNEVADRLANLAGQTIDVLFAAFKTELDRSLPVLVDAEGALRTDLSPEVRREHQNQLTEHIATIDRYQPAGEVEAGLEVLAEVSELMEVMKIIDAPPDADPDIMQAFEICARMLYLLVIEVEGRFYGVELLKLMQTVAEGSLQSPEMAVAVAPMRDSLREAIAKRAAMIKGMLAELKRKDIE